MKKRFSEEQIIGFLREAEVGLPVKERCRKHGFSEASCSLWRSRVGGMSVPEARRLKERETENAGLKKLLAEQVLQNEAIEDALRKSAERTGPTRAGAADDHPGTERAAGTLRRAHERRRLSLCDATGSQRRAPAADRCSGAAAQVLRRRDDPSEAETGWAAGERQARGGLYQEARLQVRRRKRKKVPPGERQPLTRPTAANEVWSMDFVFDRTAEGRVLKCLTVVDEATHEAVVIEVEPAISGLGVVDVRQ